MNDDFVYSKSNKSKKSSLNAQNHLLFLYKKSKKPNYSLITLIFRVIRLFQRFFGKMLTIFILIALKFRAVREQLDFYKKRGKIR